MCGSAARAWPGGPSAEGGTPSLNGTLACDPSRDGNTNSSGVRLNIDSGQQRDARTFYFRGEFHMGVASLSWHLVAMRPTPAAMVSLPPGSEGRRVRLEVPVAIRPEFTEYIDACSVARALFEGEHPDDGGGTYTLSGEVTGGLWFANAAGQLADATGAYLTPRSCATAGAPTPAVEVQVRPAMSVRRLYAVASVSMEAVIPAGAVKVGAWLRVPGCPSPDKCRPSSGVWSFDVEGSASPGVVPWFAGNDPAAFPMAPGVPVASNPLLPRSCSDRQWYRRTAQDAYVDLSAWELFTSEQEACLLDYVDELWVP